MSHTQRSSPAPHGFVAPGPDAEGLPTAGGVLLAGREDTDGRLTVIRSQAPPGDKTPLHVHVRMDEAFYVLAGSYSVRCGEDRFEAGAGDLVYLPHGIPHAYTAGAEGGTKLILGLPGGLEGFFRDMATAEDWHALGDAHDITFLPPDSG